MLVYEGGTLSYAASVRSAQKRPETRPLCADYAGPLEGYRKKHNLSQAALARLIGATPQTYCAWKRIGQRPMKAYADRIDALLRKDSGRGIKQKRQRIANTKQSVVDAEQLPPELPQSDPSRYRNDVGNG